MLAPTHPPQPAAPAGALPAGELSERVRGEQVRILYEQLPYSITGTAIAVVFLAALMWDLASRNAIVGWVLCMGANQLVAAGPVFPVPRARIDAHRRRQVGAVLGCRIADLRLPVGRGELPAVRAGLALRTRRSWSCSCSG